MAGHSQASGVEGIGDCRPGGFRIPIERRKTPWLIDEFAGIDFAAPEPFAACANNRDQRIVKQKFNVEIPLCIRHDDSPENEIHAALAKITMQHCPRGGLHHGERDSRVLPRKPGNNVWNQTGNHYLYGSDTNFSGGRIGQIVDLLNALLQIIENHRTPLEKRAPVSRRLDAVTAAIEEAHTKHALEIGNRLRNSRLGYRQLGGSLPHASELRHCLQDVEVSQLEPPSDALIPWHWRTPEMLMTASDYTIISLC